MWCVNRKGCGNVQWISFKMHKVLFHLVGDLSRWGKILAHTEIVEVLLDELDKEVVRRKKVLSDHTKDFHPKFEVGKLFREV